MTTRTDRKMAGAAIGGGILAILTPAVVYAMDTDVTTGFIVGLLFGFAGSAAGVWISELTA